QEDSYASELLHSGRCAELTVQDQGLTTELVMGVLRWRSLLDATIAKVASQPLARLDREVLTALRLGAYQLGWLDRVPARAAIHESVELVKRARKRSAAPFANAVLRKLTDTSISSEARRGLDEDQGIHGRPRCHSGRGLAAGRRDCGPGKARAGLLRCARRQDLGYLRPQPRRGGRCGRVASSSCRNLAQTRPRQKCSGHECRYS